MLNSDLPFWQRTELVLRKPFSIDSERAIEPSAVILPRHRRAKLDKLSFGEYIS